MEEELGRMLAKISKIKHRGEDSTEQQGREGAEKKVGWTDFRQQLLREGQDQNRRRASI